MNRVAVRLTGGEYLFLSAPSRNEDPLLKRKWWLGLHSSGRSGKRKSMSLGANVKEMRPDELLLKERN